jgi:hypothetical protein
MSIPAIHRREAIERSPTALALTAVASANALHGSTGARRTTACARSSDFNSLKG